MKITAVIMGMGLFITSCSPISPISGNAINKQSWKHAPAWASDRIHPQWWRQYNDVTLHQDIQSAWAENPEIHLIAARFERAAAQRQQVKAAAYPHLNLGIGYRDGRRQNIDFGPYELAPWEGGAQFSWEIDLSGRLRAAARAAKQLQDAAFWDVHAVKLLLANRIASSRFRLYRLNAELAVVQESIRASQNIVNILKHRERAGIIATAEVRQAEAEHEQLKREHMELERLRELNIVQLQTLVGGRQVKNTTRSQLPQVSGSYNIPVNRLLRSHPTLLAAEARVRSAFDQEQAARLNLLPSFRLQASATGAGKSLTGNYRVWQHRVGPNLDLPIYSPTRLAQVKVQKAERKAAAAQYRSAVLTTFEEVESAYINYASRKRQLSSVRKEVAALAETRRYAQAQFKAGTNSNVEVLQAERQWLAGKRRQLILQQQLLDDHLQLIRALGGGVVAN